MLKNVHPTAAETGWGESAEPFSTSCSTLECVGVQGWGTTLTGVNKSKAIQMRCGEDIAEGPVAEVRRLGTA